MGTLNLREEEPALLREGDDLHGLQKVCLRGHGHAWGLQQALHKEMS